MKEGLRDVPVSEDAHEERQPNTLREVQGGAKPLFAVEEAPLRDRGLGGGAPIKIRH
jgi:hypothetical protein